MKVSAVISKPNKKVIPSFIGNKSAVISAVCIVLGIIAGALIYTVNSNNLAGDLWEYFISFTMDFSQKNKPEIFSGLILQNLIYLLVMGVLGTCAFGAPAVLVTSFVKSMGLGMLTAYIYDNFALKGIEYCFMVFFPGKFILILAMILLTQNCYIMSVDIRNSLNQKGDRVADFKKYALRTAVIFLLVLISGAVDFVTIISFSSLFDFN